MKARVNSTRHILFIAMFAAALTGCSDGGQSPPPTTGMQGQVYSIATPGPTPVGWIPPPLEIVSTVVALDANHRFVLEVLTDNKGRFTIELPPGTYYLRVKESMIPSETGPYVVTAGAIIPVRAHFDSGMR
jgi:hypothetical protein